MHKQVRELVTWAAGIGFECEGLDGRGHYKLVHVNGTYRVPATQSDWRGDRNSKADMRRIAKVAHDGPRSGTHRRGVGARKPPLHLASEQEAERTEALRLARLRHRRLCDQITAHLEAPEQRPHTAIGDLAAELAAIRQDFAALGVEPPILPFRIHI